MDFIAAERPDAAVEWLDGLIARVDLLRDFPEQGHVVPGWDQQVVRQILYSPYRVVYQVEAEQVEILTISHDRERPLPERNSEG